eukprot:TRINITY_DN1090_c0_g2_i6.p1 TRINITY_DN1090_c0_g2~~TRINITY_DN1090_c0_g2_i6.p1  ORF type:complete len:113 (+),score=12.95 TRINITY_DN1090_c0_g2_i6:126-464(+)
MMLSNAGTPAMLGNGHRGGQSQQNVQVVSEKRKLGRPKGSKNKKNVDGQTPISSTKKRKGGVQGGSRSKKQKPDQDTVYFHEVATPQASRLSLDSVVNLEDSQPDQVLLQFI